MFQQRPSYIKGHVPSKAVFHQRLSSIKDHLPSKVVFHLKLSSLKGCLPSKVVITSQPPNGDQLQPPCWCQYLLKFGLWNIDIPPRYEGHGNLCLWHWHTWGIQIFCYHSWKIPPPYIQILLLASLQNRKHPLASDSSSSSAQRRCRGSRATRTAP